MENVTMWVPKKEEKIDHDMGCSNFFLEVLVLKLSSSLLEQINVIIYTILPK